MTKNNNSEQKKDLRVIKTEEAIKHSFYNLVKEVSIEKISVKALCEEAKINKSTFYAHYDSIYDLMQALEDDFITYLTDQIVSDVSLFDNPEYYFDQIMEIMQESQKRHVLRLVQSNNTFTEHLQDALGKKITYYNFDFTNHTELALILQIFFQGLCQTECCKLSESDIIYLKKFFCTGINAIKDDFI
ncbi:MAG: TetR family transcriptional regulator [Lachnospiraceae bacterium]|nr:TetR family transcriptional regulator [Lachnospiraceae bacterium]